MSREQQAGHPAIAGLLESAAEQTRVQVRRAASALKCAREPSRCLLDAQRARVEMSPATERSAGEIESDLVLRNDQAQQSGRVVAQAAAHARPRWAALFASSFVVAFVQQTLHVHFPRCRVFVVPDPFRS